MGAHPNHGGARGLAVPWGIAASRIPSQSANRIGSRNVLGRSQAQVVRCALGASQWGAWGGLAGLMAGPTAALLVHPLNSTSQAPTAGHYVALVRTPSGQWVCFDDEQVGPCQLRPYGHSIQSLVSA